MNLRYEIDGDLERMNTACCSIQYEPDLLLIVGVDTARKGPTASAENEQISMRR